MRPLMIPPLEAFRWRRRLRGIARKPRLHVVMVGLLAPQQSRIRLTLRSPRVVAHLFACARRVEFIRFFDALRKHGLKFRSKTIVHRTLLARSLVERRGIRKP